MAVPESDTLSASKTSTLIGVTVTSTVRTSGISYVGPPAYSAMTRNASVKVLFTGTFQRSLAQLLICSEV